MYGTQTIVTHLTPEQIGDLLRGIVRSELSNYDPSVAKPSSPSVSLPEYPSRRQTKEFLGVSYTTLNNWAKDSDEQSAILVPLKVGT